MGGLASLGARGFTLLELAVVLVIIGLLAGGVLLGRDLVAAAQIRAQISQIEQLKTAFTTFRIKYNCLPGDCAKGGTYGFAARGSLAGEGDGNGQITGRSNCGYCASGETLVAWMDLSAAKLIAQSFTNAVMTVCPSHIGTHPADYLPKAAIGGGNYVYVYHHGAHNLLGLSAVDSFLGNCTMGTTPRVSVLQAYSMDSKLDDGIPTLGNVIAIYVQNAVQLSPYVPWPPQPSTDWSCLHYDTQGFTYSIDYENGISKTCGLSFHLGN